MTTIVVYNPADISSTIAAAVIMSQYENMACDSVDKVKAYPASNRVPAIKDGSYVWVGVEPHPRTVAILDRHVSHAGYFGDASILHRQTLARFSAIYDATPKEECLNYDLPRHPVTPLGALMNKNDIIGPAWLIAQYAAHYAAGERVELEHQATVHLNYNNAIQTLSYGVPFMFEVSGDVDKYVAFMKEMKRHLNTIYECTNTVIDGVQHRIPFINVLGEMSPWVMKLVAEVNEYAMTYEQRGGRTIYTVFSRTAGFDEVILKQIEHNKSIGSLSNQM